MGGSGSPGGGPGGFGDEPDGEDEQGDSERRDKDQYYKEFTPVSPSKVVITVFTGVNLHSKPYMPFNKVVREFIKAQGPNGIMLLTILDEVEKYGGEPFRYTLYFQK